jgi:large subunit ribosomal protein L32e
MTTETKRLIRVRTEKNAVFKRDGFGKKPQLSDSWRKPRGLHNKQRKQKKAKGALPKPGYGSPVAVRGMHPSGFFEVLVFAEKDLENLDPKTQAIRISAGVGARKRKQLQEKAKEAGFKILNTRVIKAPVKKEEPAEKAKEASKDKKEKEAKEERKHRLLQRRVLQRHRMQRRRMRRQRNPQSRQQPRRARRKRTQSPRQKNRQRNLPRARQRLKPQNPRRSPQQG